MAFETAAAFLGGCAAGVVALGLFWRTRSSQKAALFESELEALRDALWEAQEAAERARSDGESALVEAEARAEAGARVKAKFLATVTHEMRTPLSGVIGTADLLLDTQLAAEQRTYARAVRESAHAMLSLVDEILDMSRIEAHRVTLQDAPFAVAELVESIAELLAPRAQEKGLDLAVGFGPDAPAVIVGDGARVRQILLNLAGNAIKFTARGGVGLRVDVAGDSVRFSVLDTGPGFDPADAERLFGEFEQSDATPTARGVGLGLAISRRLAAAMDGALSAHGAPGAGATFVFTLPRRVASGRISDEDEEQARAKLAGRRVLVASDTPYGGPWLVEQLGAWGAEARLVAPRDAAALAAAVAVDGAHTVLIDRSLPTPPAELEAAARRAGASRVLLMLSPAERRELSAQWPDGFDGYLVKPIRAASVVSRLDDPRPHMEVAAAAAEPLTIAAAPSRPAPGVEGGPLRVLIAEDDPVSALIALAQVARLGHLTQHVADGLAACEAFEAEPYDAVLLDLRMPALDGLVTARRLREFEAQTGRRPALILALTANVSDDDRAAAREAGMDDLLGKPLDRRTLETLLAPLRTAASRVA